MYGYGDHITKHIRVKRLETILYRLEKGLELTKEQKEIIKLIVANKEKAPAKIGLKK